VAGTILNALELILGESDSDFGLRVAGRTDAGVHAAAQVAQLDVYPLQLKRAGKTGLTPDRLNSLLPASIRINSVAVVSSEFHARFAAWQRRYRYRIADTLECQLPENARYALWHSKALDEIKMNRAAGLLLGLHDFAAFCKPRKAATTIRELRSIEVSRDGSGIGLKPE
jgi:tRNA pseudouridine38-40 synthase